MIKIGDKVKLISEQDASCLKIGDICLVTDVDPNKVYDIKIYSTEKNDWDWVQSKSVEPYIDNRKTIESYEIKDLEQISRLLRDIKYYKETIKSNQQALDNAEKRLKELGYYK